MPGRSKSTFDSFCNIEEYDREYDSIIQRIRSGAGAAFRPGHNNPWAEDPWAEDQLMFQSTACGGRREEIDLSLRYERKAEVERLHAAELIQRKFRKSAALRQQDIQRLRQVYITPKVHRAGGGNCEYYSDDMLLKREQLKREPLVKEALEHVWRAADQNGNGKIDRDEYVAMSRRLYLVLHEGRPDPFEAQRTAIKDWEADSHGFDHLNRKRFQQSWFQLADLYTKVN